MLIKCLFSALIFVASFSSSESLATETLPVTQSSVIYHANHELTKNELIDQLFSYLTYIGKSDNKADVMSLQKYMSADCVIQSNNEIVATGVTEIVFFSQQMQKKYSLVTYSNFLEAPIISENKAVIHFHVTGVTLTGSKELIDTIAILTFSDGKIIFWNEVYHTISKP